ncbi:MAG: 16S rRNA (cytosine(967)-C(5))-methyltransferase RsmB [Lachnospiraceae bacterium]|nr:16S rRNA (cytosine(967)-C(5))-methyltransferase RsmB [Lachnospiraceae bacterium]
MENERLITMNALMEILEKGGYFHIVMGKVLDKYSYLPAVKRHFIRCVAGGCVEKRICLDYCIDLYSKTKTEKMKPVIRTILRMGTYQLLFMDNIPPSAAVNESVKLARQKGFSQLSGFVNGVLRKIASQKDMIVFPDREKDRTLYLSVKYSFPEWLARYADELYGKEKSESVLEVLGRKKRLSIRLSELMDAKKKEKLLSDMKDKGVILEKADGFDNVYYMENPDDIRSLPGFEEGLFYIQDTGAAAVVAQADIKASDVIVDVCSAPGGKAIHAAERLEAARRKAPGEKTGYVIARDLTDKKTEIIRENVERCRLENVIIQKHDATVFDKELEGKADILIADLPCSGLGVISKKPDIRYRVLPEDITALQSLQRKILTASIPYVKPGGVLIYSTCTITREENEDNRDWILAGFPFEIISEKRLTPGEEESDGFYILMLKKKGS